MDSKTGWVRKLALAALALALLLTTILTWGSLGSAVTAFLLILMGSALLYRRFLIDNEDNDFDME